MSGLQGDHEWKSKIDHLRQKISDELKDASESLVNGNISMKKVERLDEMVKCLDEQVQRIADYTGYTRDYRVVEKQVV